MFEIIPFGSRQDDWFDRFFDSFEKSFWGTGSDLASFRADCSDDGKNFIVEAELPGFKKEDISLDVDGDTLTIHAEHKDEKDSSDSSKNHEHLWRGDLKPVISMPLTTSTVCLQSLK